MPDVSGHHVTLADVSLSYPNGVKALNGISVCIGRGEFVAVIGPNGSGKSTLLRTAMGLLPADNGEVLVNGRPILSLTPQERAREIALVPQAPDIQTGYSVEDFVLLGRYAHLSGWKLFDNRDHEIVRECLTRVDAIQFLNRGMKEMSGGERQRVLLARALAQESRIILLDEPTSALDLHHQLMVYRLIHSLHRDSGRSIVVVTHDLNLASQFADRLLLMDHGSLAAEGPPAAILRKEVLSRVYPAELTFGTFADTVGGGGRPWVLPWAKP